MPAVTAPDSLVLPQIVSDPTWRLRPVTRITTAPSGFEGEGFPVKRAFAGVPAAELDPFIHMDQMGAVDYGPGEPKGTPWHPHRGFETVTYIIDGIFEHRDSIGGGGVITNGDTQWMTAGGGILHIERPPESLVVTGGLFHGIQLWVNLPAAKKFIDPHYQDVRAGDVTLIRSEDGSSLVRVIAGDVGAFHGPGSTQTPITVAHATIASGGRLMLPLDPTFNALVYALSGTGSVGADAVALTSGQLATFGAGDAVEIRGGSGLEPFDVLILAGQPIREPLAVYGPFVMNTKEELQQAFDDFHAGKLGTIPADA